MDHRRKPIVAPCRQGSIAGRRRRSDQGAGCRRVRSQAVTARGDLDLEPTVDFGRMRGKHHSTVARPSGEPAGTGRG